MHRLAAVCGGGEVTCGTLRTMSRKAIPIIDPARCTGCGRCIGACPPHVLWLEADGPNGMGRKRSVLHDQPGCTGCAKCMVVCPFDAIDMQRQGASV